MLTNDKQLGKPFRPLPESNEFPRWDKATIRAVFETPRGTVYDSTTLTRTEALGLIQQEWDSSNKEIRAWQGHEGLEPEQTESARTMYLTQLGDRPETEDDLTDFEKNVLDAATDMLSGAKLLAGSQKNSAVVVAPSYVEVFVEGAPQIVIPAGVDLDQRAEEAGDAE